MFYKTEKDCKECDIDTMKLLGCNCFIDKKAGIYNDEQTNPLEEQLNNYKNYLY